MGNTGPANKQNVAQGLIYPIAQMPGASEKVHQEKDFGKVFFKILNKLIGKMQKFWS